MQTMRSSSQPWHGAPLIAVTTSELRVAELDIPAAESDPPVPGAQIGGLFKVGPWGSTVTELAADQLILPGGADVARNGRVYVTGPVFGRGSLVKLAG